MFFLTEFALHTHLNAFGARTMTALYAAAMFVNGCGYLLFPLLARTRMATEDKNRFVPRDGRALRHLRGARRNIHAAWAEAPLLVRRDGLGRLPRRRVALGRSRLAAPDRNDRKALRCGRPPPPSPYSTRYRTTSPRRTSASLRSPQPRPSSSGPCRRRPASLRARLPPEERTTPAAEFLLRRRDGSCSSATSTASGTAS